MVIIGSNSIFKNLQILQIENTSTEEIRGHGFLILQTKRWHLGKYTQRTIWILFPTLSKLSYRKLVINISDLILKQFHFNELQ